jgi:putative sterol carrier protein
MGENGKSRRRPAQVMADLFARRVASRSDARLEKAMRGIQRRPVLNGVFRQMPKQLDRERAKSTSAVIEWRIGGRRDGGEDRYQVVIEEGHARSSRKPDREPTVMLKMDAVTFLRLVTGTQTGPALFMTGKLSLDGDLSQATTLQTLFRMPSPERPGGG